MSATASVTDPVEQSDCAGVATAPPSGSASSLFSSLAPLRVAVKTRLLSPCSKQLPLVCSQEAMLGSAATAMPAGRNSTPAKAAPATPVQRAVIMGGFLGGLGLCGLDIAWRIGFADRWEQRSAPETRFRQEPDPAATAQPAGSRLGGPCRAGRGVSSSRSAGSDAVRGHVEHDRVVLHEPAFPLCPPNMPNAVNVVAVPNV